MQYYILDKHRIRDARHSGIGTYVDGGWLVLPRGAVSDRLTRSERLVCLRRMALRT